MFTKTTPWCKSKHSKWGQLRDSLWTRSPFLSSDANFQRHILGWEPLSLPPKAGLNLAAFRRLPQLPVLCGEMEACFRIVACWRKVFNSVNNNFPAKTYAVEKYQIYSEEEKQNPQISGGSSKNEWYYLRFSKVVGTFCCILRLSLQNVQNKTSTEGDAGEDPSAAPCLWRAERVGKLTTGRVPLTCSQKVCLFIGILGCSQL